MSPEAVCPRFKQNAWKKELCSNCFRPKEEHPQKPKRVHVDYKPLPEVSPSQSILKVNGSCDKSRNVSFSITESEVIGYGGEEYSTDEDYSSDEESHGEYFDSGDDDELRRLTEANTNINSKLMVPEKVVNNVPKAKATTVGGHQSTPAKPTLKKSPPLVTVQPLGVADPPKSLVFNFLKNKEIAAATAAAAAAKEAQKIEKKDTDDVQLRKTDAAKKTTLSRSSLVANSNEPYLNIKRCSLPSADEQAKISSPPLPPNLQEIPQVKLHPPETVCKSVEDHAPEKDAQPPPPPPPLPPTTTTTTKDPEIAADTAAGPYKMRTNVPRMGTMQFKLKLSVASSLKPESTKPALHGNTAESTPESSLTSREMAGEPDGKADSDEPGDPTMTTMMTATSTTDPTNRSFLHNFKDVSPSPLRNTTNVTTTTTTPPRTPPKKISVCSNGSGSSSSSNNSPPECPRSIKRQAPKPPPPPPSTRCSLAAAAVDPGCLGVDGSLSDDEFRPVDAGVVNRKLLAEYCEQMEREQSSVPPPPPPSHGNHRTQDAVTPHGNHRTQDAATPLAEGAPLGDSSTLPSVGGKRPGYEKKKFSKAGRMGLKIKKFLRIPSRESVGAPQQPSPRPKLEIIHPLDINKSAVEIIYNAADYRIGGSALAADQLAYGVATPPPPPPQQSNNNHFAAARPTKPPPPPRSLPPVAKPAPTKTTPREIAEDYPDAPKTCDSSTSEETYEPVNFSAPECDHSSPEMARLTSMQCYGSETESEIYPAIQFGDDFGAEDSVRNTQPGRKSLEESYDAVVIANHEALTKLLDQATCGPKIPKELLALKTKSLEWSDFRVDSTSRLQKSNCAFYNAKWYDVPVVLSVSGDRVELNNVLNNHFTLTKVTEFVTRVGKEYAPGAENEDAYVTLWNVHRVEAVDTYCKEYNAKYADVTKEAGLILVETVNLLMGLQASDVERYSLEPFVVTRNGFGADPTVAVIQLRETEFEDLDDTLCEIMLKVLKMLAPTWEMTVCLSQVLRQDKPNSLSKCKALLEFWLWGPTGVTAAAAVAPVDHRVPLLSKRWLDLERAKHLHGLVCSSADMSVERICRTSFLVADDEKLFSYAWTATLRAARISKR